MEARLKPRLPEITVHRAQPCEVDAAWQIVSEYYEAANVVAQDSKPAFAANYFAEGAGVWLATSNADVLGCIALRSLASITNAGEVKRLYVRPEARGRGIASALYRALETYAAEIGYRFLYLDTAAGMIAAQKFYEALGFERCSRYNDNPQATIFMQKTVENSGK
jgi:ribosomal protein S18 acetylase RimI-like enzyme